MPIGIDRPGGKPGPKVRSATEREMVLAEVARLDRLGHSQREIGRLLAGRVGFAVSQGTVSGYLKEVRKRHLDAMLEDRRATVASALAQLREVRREAWEAWERSKADAVRRATRRVQGPPGAVAEVVETAAGRLPANEYLLTVLNTLRQERELLGLDEASQVEVKGAVATVPWEALYGAGPRPSGMIERRTDAPTDPE